MPSIHKTIIMFLTILVSCTSAKKTSVASQENQHGSPAVEKYKTLAMEKYNDRIDYISNESKTYVLCSKTNKSTPKIPQNSLFFFVYDLKNDRVVIEESVVDGSVTWISDHQIEIIQKTGIVTKDNPDHRQGYIFDLNTGEKSTLSKKALNLKQ